MHRSLDLLLQFDDAPVPLFEDTTQSVRNVPQARSLIIDRLSCRSL